MARTLTEPLVSICIPTYNGAGTILETLECIVDQYENGIEVVACDDRSTDGTYEKVVALSRQHDFITVHRNDRNLGMDGNFRQTALHASGKYVWFFGQDDLMEAGAVQKVTSVLREHPHVGIVYVNYAQYDHDMRQVLCPSFLKARLLDQDLSLESDLHFQRPEEYFNAIEALPSFLPATVIRREYWEDTDVAPFHGTAFIQVGLMLLNMYRGSIYVITKPYIKGRIPNDQWQSDGTQHFNIMTGSLKMYKLVHDTPDNPLPEHLYRSQRWRYLANYFFLVRLCKNRGLKAGKEQVIQLGQTFGHGPIFLFYLVPLLFMPRLIMNGINFFLYPLKRLIMSVLKRFGIDLGY